MGRTSSRRSGPVGRIVAGRFAWSPDGTRLALGGDRIQIYDVRARTTRTLTTEGGSPVWSPNGRLLAISSKAGITLVDVRTGKTRLLTRDASGERLSWAPDGRSLAYVVHQGFDYRLEGLEFNTIGLNGRIRTIVAAGDRYGGELAGMVWMKPPAGVRYRKPRARSLATVSADEQTAPGTIAHGHGRRPRGLRRVRPRLRLDVCDETVEQAEPTTSLSPW
jgi:dipeptidyl aminopeptidase/acylaminoacyl peptidase